MKLNYSKKDIRNGLIPCDSKIGKRYGLTSDRFTEDSYLWLTDNTLWISMLISRKEGHGYVRNIIDIAKKKGHKIMCMPVSSRMIEILEKNGFILKGDYYIWKK